MYGQKHDFTLHTAIVKRINCLLDFIVATSVTAIPKFSLFLLCYSYGGMLTAYMRYKYPHIIDGGVASSAPFLTIAGNRPRSEFFQAVTNVSLSVLMLGIFV